MTRHYGLKNPRYQKRTENRYDLTAKWFRRTHLLPNPLVVPPLVLFCLCCSRFLPLLLYVVRAPLPKIAIEVLLKRKLLDREKRGYIRGYKRPHGPNVVVKKLLKHPDIRGQ